MLLVLLLGFYKLSMCQSQFETVPDEGTEFVPVEPGSGVLTASSANQIHPGVQLNAPWHLDRIDQRQPRLDQAYYEQVRVL
jgi:hypothetical protein